MIEAPASAGARPGATYFVPGLRISMLSPVLQPGEIGVPIPQDVLYDVTRVEVSRVNTGACQYTITLNNWYLGTAADRAARQRGVHAGGRGGTPAHPDRPPRPAAAFRHELYEGDRPVWPRFKYNDFFELAFGDRLRIDMRYWPDPQPGVDVDLEGSQSWVPMIAGPITDMRFSFGKGAELTVSGEDDLSILKDKVDKQMGFEKLAELSIVRKLLERVNYPLRDVAQPLVPHPAFVTDDSQGVTETLQAGQSPLDFMQKIAQRLDYEIFLEFSDPGVPESPLEFHYEPWRSRCPPLGAGRDVFTVHRERNLVDFSPNIKVLDQYSAVTVKGRNRDPQVPTEISGTASHDILADELHIDPSVDGPLLSGPEVRDHFFPDRPNNYVLQNQSNLDEARADTNAQAVIRKKARELFTVEGTTIGSPRLRPGYHVEIRGMRPPFDGFFYLTKTTHSIGTDGFRTRFTASRPGMELPPTRGGRYVEDLT